MPDGGVDVLDRGNGVHVAVVKWRPPASGNGDEPLCAEPGVRRAVIESWLHRQIEITESGAVAHWRRVAAKPFQTSSP
ncbi:hypothetical protein [Burkholderia sp. PAMC 26561]|uniref:hypothetical protein n=1 Tax=Burkholderia sp. PAMC 26561 TaxID=1795043 RepID=UPI00076B1EC6|nr:hypothetical protein [Burkholderia sp. PAMC 26561]AME22946.1 hypothetical protein AXG89_02975 [Burkholderia sp. PAMC 26561]